MTVWTPTGAKLRQDPLVSKRHLYLPGSTKAELSGGKSIRPLLVTAEKNKTTRIMMVHWKDDTSDEADVSATDCDAMGGLGGVEGNPVSVRVPQCWERWRYYPNPIEFVAAILVALAAISAVVAGLTDGSAENAARHDATVAAVAELDPALATIDQSVVVISSATSNSDSQLYASTTRLAAADTAVHDWRAEQLHGPADTSTLHTSLTWTAAILGLIAAGFSLRTTVRRLGL